MSGELVFIISGASATVAQPISLAEAGLTERGHLQDRLPEGLRPVYEDLNEALLGLGPDMSVRSRVKSFKYYRRRKLCDVLIHADHLSVFIRNVTPDDDTGLAVGGTGKYVHTQVRTVGEVQQLPPLLRHADTLQNA